MIEYRAFQNCDPPYLVTLWHQCRLGRGAAAGFTSDVFETLLLSLTYFDPAGLIVACEDNRLVGFIHAGFGSNETGTALAHDHGVICAVMVHPDFRRKGIGRELVSRAEQYLSAAGTRSIYAGPSHPRDPFYVGLYCGSRLSGFLESDSAADPFFTAQGYQSVERHAVMQRDLGQSTDPMSFRFATLRRKMELAIFDRPEHEFWWWLTRFGELDTVRFSLVPRQGGAPAASATVLSLDLYIDKWNARAVGITDLHVPETERRQGFGQALILEICRRLRQEMVTCVEAHVPETNLSALELVRSAGFAQVDTGIVYCRDDS